MSLPEQNLQAIEDLKKVDLPVPGVAPSFIRLVNHMGSDQEIVQVARTSFGFTRDKKKTDRDVLRRLMRHRHTSPIETATALVFYISVPMDLMRQLVRFYFPLV